MRKLTIIFIGFLLLGCNCGQFLYAKNSTNESISYISEIVNNSNVPLIISSPFMMVDQIDITKNVSLKDRTESIPPISSDFKDSLIVPAQTKSFITNLRLPKVDEDVTVPADFTLRPNNYNPGTMQAICIHIPPQKYALNYTLVHKPLPIFAFRQKGEFLDGIAGEGLRHVAMLDQLNNLQANQDDNFYTIEVNQIQPIGYLKSVRHEAHELYDLSSMYLDGGAEVSPLSVDPSTFDIAIRPHNKLEYGTK